MSEKDNEGLIVKLGRLGAELRAGADVEGEFLEIKAECKRMLKSRNETALIENRRIEKIRGAVKRKRAGESVRLARMAAQCAAGFDEEWKRRMAAIKDENPARYTEKREAAELLGRELVKTLGAIDRYIFSEYLAGAKLSELAMELELSRSRVHQRLQRAINRLRQPCRREIFETFVQTLGS